MVFAVFYWKRKCRLLFSVQREQGFSTRPLLGYKPLHKKLTSTEVLASSCGFNQSAVKLPLRKFHRTLQSFPIKVAPRCNPNRKCVTP